MKMEYQHLVSNFYQIDLRNKIVLLRADANVPMSNGKILDDFKLREMNRSLSGIIERGACCIVLTHLGDPKRPTKKFSTKHLLSWFQQHYDVQHVPDFEALETIEKKIGTVLLFENLRFFKEEKGHDQLFAKKLALFGDVFVADAFGAVHRSDTSITLLPLEFKKEQRTIGILIEKEIATYRALLKKRPSLLIVGGGKPETKLPLVIRCAPHFDTVLVCPLLSEIETTMDIPKNIIYPNDYNIYRNVKTNKKTEKKEYEIYCKTIGPKTTMLYQQYIKKATLIMWNGFMGFLEKPETLKSSQQLAKAIEESHATKIIAGADTCNFVQYHTDNPINSIHYSTGGGSSLALIAGEKLPGLEPFL